MPHGVTVNEGVTGNGLWPGPKALRNRMSLFFFLGLEQAARAVRSLGRGARTRALSVCLAT
jgi:hypothetical protein